MRKTVLSALIDLNTFPVRDVLNILLQDKTKKYNIIFATDAYDACTHTKQVSFLP